MRLTIISPFPPKTGGLSEYTKRNAAYFKTVNNLTTKIIPFNSFLDILNVCRLNSTHANVVRLEFNIPAYGLASTLLPFIIAYYRIFTKTVFVVNYHEVKRETDLLGPIGRWYYAIFSSLFHQIYVHTNEAKKILIGQCKVSENKISVIPHGLYHATLSTITETELNQKYGLNDKKMVLFFGFIHPDKGIEYLVEAIKLLRDQEPEITKQLQVVIAGGVRKRSGIFKLFEGTDQRYNQLISHLIQEYELSSIISRINYVDENDVDALLKKAYIYVLPYTNAEQSGVLNLLIPYEKPIIATTIGGLDETLSDAGVLIAPHNATELAVQVELLLQNESKYQQVSDQYKKLRILLDPKDINNQFIQECRILLKQQHEK